MPGAPGTRGAHGMRGAPRRYAETPSGVTYVLGGRVGVSETACGRGGYLDPSPYPLPWPWKGRFAGRWGVQDGPRWLREGLREPKMASKIAQDSPTWLNIAHNMPTRSLKTAPRRLQVAKTPPKEAPEMPKSLQHLRNNNVFGLLVFSLLRRPQRPPRRPRTAPRGPKSPKRPKSSIS